MIDRKLLKNLDIPFVIALVSIIALGLLILSSATVNTQSDQWYYVKKQVVGITLGLCCMGVILYFDYGILFRYSKLIYGFSVFILVLVLIVGKTTKGMSGWINIGSFGLQPSEIAKILFIITFAVFLVQRQDRLDTLRDLIPAFIHLGIPLFLILLQPDLGTSLVYIAIFFGMLFVAGARTSLLLKILGVGALIVAVALIGHLKFDLPLPLKDYQINRLIIFVDPYMDVRGDGWHIIQSLVAIGSGGLWGKGLFNGTQVQGNFLPEHHTDFIFAVVGEELGFIGASVVIMVYFLLLFRTVNMAFKSRDQFGTLICIGIASMWIFHILENIGMAIGIMPITGIPLPFLSAGGSSILANFLAVGLLLNINLRREKILFS